MSPRCEDCGGQLIVLEIFCTDPYSKSVEWFRDIKKRCVCDSCGKEQEITVETVKQAKDRYFRKIAELHPMSRIGDPKEIAEAILFLASNDSSFITGTALSVDGGLTAK